MEKQLSETVVADTILQLLIDWEEAGVKRPLSPTTVCEELHRHGYPTLEGWNDRPTREAMYLVRHVAEAQFTTEHRGNSLAILGL